MNHSSKKARLVFALTLQILTSTALQANFDLDDINTETHVKHYNALPLVEESDTLLKTSSQFNPFLNKAEEVVIRYELESFVGLRLIHKHFLLGDNQVMTEEHEIIKDIPSLVTQAHQVEEAQAKRAIPASWIFSNNLEEGALLFEASNDSAVQAGSVQLQKSPEFFSEMEKLLKEYKLNNLLSMALLKRDSLIAQENQVYMEANSGMDKKSIVQLWDASDISQNTIRTSWSFKGPKQQGCQPITYCVWDPDWRIGHIGQRTEHF